MTLHEGVNKIQSDNLTIIIVSGVSFVEQNTKGTCSYSGEVQEELVLLTTEVGTLESLETLQMRLRKRGHTFFLL